MATALPCLRPRITGTLNTAELVREQDEEKEHRT
jgi:hypothetical protein